MLNSNLADNNCGNVIDMHAPEFEQLKRSAVQARSGLPKEYRTAICGPDCQRGNQKDGCEHHQKNGSGENVCEPSHGRVESASRQLRRMYRAASTEIQWYPSAGGPDWPLS